jgi:hypothetical protein
MIRRIKLCVNDDFFDFILIQKKFHIAGIFKKKKPPALGRGLVVNRFRSRTLTEAPRGGCFRLARRSSGWYRHPWASREDP